MVKDLIRFYLGKKYVWRLLLISLFTILFGSIISVFRPAAHLWSNLPSAKYANLVLPISLADSDGPSSGASHGSETDTHMAELLRQIVLRNNEEQLVLNDELMRRQEEADASKRLRHSDTKLLTRQKNEEGPNEESFLSTLSNVTRTSFDVVIVVQVHDRLAYLEALIRSMAQVKNIHRALLIFSHDYVDERINQLVKRIKFCRVMQIFYPYSLQLYPNTFPGRDPRDCDRDAKKSEAEESGCLNAAWPDSYGHYREAKFSQTKHHWWWKMNFVMEKCRLTRNFGGYFLFIEEDHYLSPDALHFLRLMIHKQTDENFAGDILTLGTYSKSVSFSRYGDKVERIKWKHNMGMVLNRETWLKLRPCAATFCGYDDYNWDWSLMQVSLQCLKKPLNVLAALAPRVFHIGECGMHHKNRNCDKNVVLNRVRNVLSSSSAYLFPAALQLKLITKRTFKMPKPNGGWSDRRDIQLCLNHSRPYSVDDPSLPSYGANKLFG